MRTLSQSEMTCVPPVTAERSPPLSRITGALSPVIAASLTEATPSTTSPSDGIMSPASTSTTSPGFSAVPATSRHSATRPDSSLARAPRFARGRALRLPAALGDRLGEIREDDGEPQPEIDLEREAVIAGVGDEV